MSGKRNDVVNPGMVDPDGTGTLGLHERKPDRLSGARWLGSQHLLHTLQDQRFRRATLSGGARLEPAVQGVRNIDCRPHPSCCHIYGWAAKCATSAGCGPQADECFPVNLVYTAAVQQFPDVACGDVSACEDRNAACSLGHEPA